MRQTMVRQGDVLLRPTDARPTGRRCEEAGGRIVLAHGEATGHAHTVVALREEALAEGPPAQFFEEPDGARLLLVSRPCAVVHQEHGPITLAPGTYYVVRQREYAPEGLRNVSD
jgi:hypothetical protein